MTGSHASGSHTPGSHASWGSGTGGSGSGGSGSGGSGSGGSGSGGSGSGGSGSSGSGLTVPGYMVTGPATGPVSGAGDRLGGRDLLGAVEEGTRRRVLLRRLPALSDDERSRVSGLLARYAEVEDDNLADPVALAEGADALVLPAPDHVPLSALWDSPWTPGQVVTVVVPVAAALAAVHAAGLAHGALGPHAVLLDTDGRPRLGDAGEQAVLHALAPAEVAEPSVEADDQALRDLLAALTERVDDASFHERVAAALASEPDAAAVAGSLLDQVEPEPLGAIDPAAARSRARHTDDPDGDGERWWRRPRLVGLVVAVVLASVIGAVVLVTQTHEGADVSEAGTDGRTDIPDPANPQQALADATDDAGAADDASATADAAVEPPAGTDLCGAPGPAPDEPPALPEDWADVVTQLYVRRSAALVTGQTSLLCEVYDPRSPGLESDLALDGAYAEQGVRPDALVFVVEDASLAGQEGALLTVQITDRLEPYRLLDASGSVVAELPGIETDTWQARLVPDATGQQWRFG